MKFILLFLCTLMVSVSYAQDYIPIWETGNIWNLKNIGCPDPCITSYDELEIIGEVTIDGIVYKDLTNGNASSYVREDNGLIYRYVEFLNDEVLVMDFTLEIGEVYTFPPPFDGGIFEDMQVVSVTTQMIAGEMRKVIDFEDTMGDGIPIETWIEGIGSDYGLFPGGNNMFDATTELTCFTKDGTTYFFNGNSVCFVVAGVEDVDMVDAVLYPNPISSTGIFQFSSEGIVDQIHILDLNGRLVSKITVVGDNAAIDATSLHAGIYFYQVYSEKQLLKIEKFIVK